MFGRAATNVEFRLVVKESENKLESSVSEFLRVADAAERQSFEETRMRLQVIIDEVHKEHRNQYTEKAAGEQSLVERFKSRYKAASETVYQ